MDYIVHPMWFYLIDSCGDVSVFFAVIGALVLVIGVVYALESADNNKKEVSQGIKVSLLGVLMVLIASLIPSERTAYKMAVASMVTKQSAKIAKEEVKEIFEYIVKIVNENK